MATAGKPQLHGLAALLGSEGKRRLILELARGKALSLPELVERTGLKRNTVSHSLRQLSEARLVVSRRERGRVVAESAPEHSALMADLARLDESPDDVWPVPGRALTKDELDRFERHLDSLPCVVVADDFAGDELTTPLSMLVIGDPVD